MDSYAALALFTQIWFIFLAIIDTAIAYRFYREFLLTRKTTFHFLLFGLMICSFGVYLVNAVTPNETISHVLGYDKVPVSPKRIEINIFMAGFLFYEFIVGFVLVSYLRSRSIVGLRPKVEQYVLSIAVFLCVFLLQFAAAMFILKWAFGISQPDYNTITSTAGIIYFTVDLYYLVRFVSFVRERSSDAKLRIIAKYGIAECLFFVLALALQLTDVFFVNPIFYMFFQLFVETQMLFGVCLYVKMSYDLRAASEESNSSLSPPSNIKTLSPSVKLPAEKFELPQEEA